MKAAEALIAWTPNRPQHEGDPTRGRVKVGPLLTEADRYDWTDPFVCTGGAAIISRRSLNKWQSIAMTFIEFHTIVVGDEIDPQIAHEAFLAIDEYRQRISPDMRGAEDLA